jgi:hypothetical protein
MFGALSRMASRAAAPRGGAIAPPSPQRLYGLLGPPPRDLRPDQDHILSDVFSQPYRDPGSLDNYGGETAEMRRRFRTEERESPILRAAIRGKATDICCLPPTVQSADKDDAESNRAAEFVQWAIQGAPGGFPGLFDAIYRPGSIDGWSLCVPKLKVTQWKGRTVWALDTVRSVDTVHIALQLDVYRNVVGVVNKLRGLEYYDPADVILYTHHGLYGNVFGQSDARPAVRATAIIADVYKVWFVALKVYGLPYMKGKYGGAQTKAALAAALKGLREGGYIVLDKDSDVEILNLAAAAATTGFEAMVNIQRQDVFYGVRGAALPFLEGSGGASAHGDTEVEQGTSDAGEKFDAHMLADVINRQLVPRLVAPNFDLGEARYPRLTLGGTNWKQIKAVAEIIKTAQDLGVEVSAEFAHKELSLPAPRDANDKLVSAQERQQQQAQQQQQQQPAATPAAPAPQAPAAFSADPGAVQWLAPSSLAADPARFQFRPRHAPDGTVRELPAERFDPARSPPLLAWRDPAGGAFVVDGHHRLAWAKRDGAARVPVEWLDADTAAEARRAGARANGVRPPATFSAAPRPGPAPDPQQVARVAAELIAEMCA